MIVSMVLAMIGTADIIRTAPAARLRTTAGRLVRAAPSAAIVILAVVAVLALGLPVVWAAACCAIAVAWTVLMPVDHAAGAAQDRDAPPLWPAVALLALLVTLASLDSTTVVVPSALSELVEGSPRRLLENVSSETVLAVVAVCVTMTQTANLVVRAALGRGRSRTAPAGSSTSPAGPQAPGTLETAGTPHAPGTPETARPREAREARAAGGTLETSRWSLVVGGRTIGILRGKAARPSSQPQAPDDGAATARQSTESTESTDDHRSHQPMRGGRHIGPVERILVLAALLAGAFPVVAGLFAAKGIVRFPEIADDRSSGGKAEEFLVGSMTSWLIAGAAAGYLTLVAAG